MTDTIQGVRLTLAQGDWDILWATGSCFTGRPRGDRIL